ncbi:MAG: phytoene/squalene synthase family protein [Chryseosolibacter sp.]
MKALFDEVSIRCSRLTTNAYSTSFSLGIYCLERPLRDPIYTVYGFVRFADEIVDTFHEYNKASLFERFKESTREAIEERISLNPILNSFQATVHQYQIEWGLIDRFLKSMEMDLYRKSYDDDGFRDYITGSAEVVGLMCLRVFCNGNKELYEQLKAPAMSLGSAFQKVNFLRDLKADFAVMGRCYFPGVEVNRFNEQSKKEIEKSIEIDFRHAFDGIKRLPRSARFGVYMAYMYYLALFKKIRNTPSEKVLHRRIRIPNRHKATLLAYSFVKHQLNMI